MRFTTRCVLAAGLAVAVVATADAQQRRQGGGFGGGMFGGGGVYGMVAQNKDLQAELKVTDEQKAKLEEAMKPINEARREMFQGFTPGQPPSEEQQKEMREKMAKMTADTRKAVEGVLTADQTKRLTQINYQFLGVNAFANEDVQKELKLTDGQKEKVKGIADEYAKDNRELMQGGFRFRPGQAPSDEDRKKMEETRKKGEALRKDALEKIQEVLTDDQKTAWKGMVGEKFDTSKLTPGFGGGRPRRDN
jgi:Spy/CpxP family protein refolding chaperone